MERFSGTRQARAAIQGQLLYEYAKKIIAPTQQAQIAIQTIGEGCRRGSKSSHKVKAGLFL